MFRPGPASSPISVPENEWNETLNKARGLLKAIGLAERHVRESR